MGQLFPDNILRSLVVCLKKELLLVNGDSNSINAFMHLEETLFTPFDDHIKILRSVSLNTAYQESDHSHIEEITQKLRKLVDSLREITIDLLCSENSTQLVAQRKTSHVAFGAQMTAYLDIKFNNNDVHQELAEIIKMTDTIWKAIFDMADESSKQKKEATKENPAPGQHSLFHPKTSPKAAQQKSRAPLGSQSNPRKITAGRVGLGHPQR